LAGGSGGVLACCTAGFMVMLGGAEIDPNVYFGIYMSIIILLLISSIFLSKDWEPEIIIHQRIKEFHNQMNPLSEAE